MDAKQMQDESRYAIGAIDFHPDAEAIDAALNRGLFVVIEAVPAYGPFDEVLGMVEHLDSVEGCREDAEAAVAARYEEAGAGAYDLVVSYR